MHLESKVSGGFSLSLYQARLDISVSSIGSMSPQIQICYSGITVRTKVATGMDKLPVWSETFNFEYLDDELEVIAIHKPLLLKDVEIGRCKINVEDCSGWFELNKEGKKVGSVRLAIKEDRETTMRTSHTTKDSWDLRDDYIRKLNELELEKEEALFFKKKYKLKLEKVRQRKRKSSGTRLMTEDTSENYGSFCSSTDQESPDLIGKIQAQIKKLKSAQEDLLKRKELLRIQEENLSSEKQKLSQEWEEVHKARQDYSVLKQKINEEYQKIRNEQMKIQSQGKCAELTRQQNLKSNREQQRYKQIMHRMQCIGSPEIQWRYENTIDRRSLSIEDLHEKAQVNRVPQTVEKPRPPLHPLSANSSRLITFE